MTKRGLVLFFLVVFGAAFCLAAGAPAAEKGPLSFPKRCSTVVFGKNATADGSVLMAHTEDVGADQTAHFVYHPRRSYGKGQVKRLTSETIPEAPVTYAYYSNDMFDPSVYQGIYLDGINEFGLAITTNAITTKELAFPLKHGGISILEMMQLVMERCKTAKEGVELIAHLQDTYGTMGAWPEVAYVLADANEAWTVECTARHWVAKRCPDDGALFYANEMIITDDYDKASADLIPYAVKKGWCEQPKGNKINFKEVYGDKTGQPWNVDRMRREDFLLRPKVGTVTVRDLMAFLRDHYEGTSESYHYPPHYWAVPGGNKYTVCNANTRDAMVWHLRSYMPADIGSVLWYCQSSPCSSVFQPIWAGARGKTPEEYNQGTNLYDLHAAWWAFESLQRMGDRDYKNRNPLIRETWRQREEAEFELAAEREMLAMMLWQQDKKDEARQLLTRLQNACLHGNYLAALDLLGVLYTGPGSWSDLGEVEF